MHRANASNAEAIRAENENVRRANEERLREKRQVRGRGVLFPFFFLFDFINRSRMRRTKDDLLSSRRRRLFAFLSFSLFR